LLIAIGFAAVVNLGLVASFWWPELLAPQVLALTWVSIALIWGASVWFGCRFLTSGWTGKPSGSDEALFNRAQTEYLCRHWLEAELLLRELLKQNSHDVDAHLLLATLCRRAGRTDEARQWLDRLARMDGSEKWILEASRERDRLDEMEPEEGSLVQHQEDQDASGVLASNG
jgi:hypothetical protein